MSGPDFVSRRGWSPDGRRLCWLSGTTRTCRGTATELRRPGPRDRRARRWSPAGRRSRSASRVWQPDGTLCSSPTAPAGGTSTAGHPGRRRGRARWCEMDAEIGLPQWVFGQSRYAFLADGRVVFAAMSTGFDQLCRPRSPDGTVSRPRRCRTRRSSRCGPLRRRLGRHGGGDPADRARGRARRPGRRECGRRRRPSCARPATSASTRRTGPSPEPIEFPDRRAAATAHALVLPAAQPGRRGAGRGAAAAARDDPRRADGGGAAGAAARRSSTGPAAGFAVVDVNYGGSTGLRPGATATGCAGTGASPTSTTAWPPPAGSADQGRVDRDRLCIRGGSAGGFTTLAALTRAETPFAAGANHFGVADLERAGRGHAQVREPLPRRAGRRRTRSARTCTTNGRRSTTSTGSTGRCIVLQGAEDEVVPPEQSRDDRRGAARQAACRSPTWRSRASSTGSVAAENIRPRARRRAVLLRPGARLRPARRRGDRAGRGGEPPPLSSSFSRPCRIREPLFVVEV